LKNSVRHRTTKHAVVTSVLAIAAFSPAAATTDDVRKHIQAAYDGECSAALAKNADAFEAFFSPSFVARGLNGVTETLAQVTSGIGEPPAGVAFSTCAFSIRSITIESERITVSVTQTISGAAIREGSATPFSQTEESTDTWTLSSTPVETSSTLTGARATLGNKHVEQGTFAPTPAPSPPRGRSFSQHLRNERL
jgi:hypothetical protein